MKNLFRIILITLSFLFTSHTVFSQEKIEDKKLEINNEAISDAVNNNTVEKKKCEPDCKKACCASKTSEEKIEGKKSCAKGSKKACCTAKKKCSKVKEGTASTCDKKKKKCKKACKDKKKKIS